MYVRIYYTPMLKCWRNYNHVNKEYMEKFMNLEFILAAWSPHPKILDGKNVSQFLDNMKQKWSLWLVLFRSSKPEFFSRLVSLYRDIKSTRVLSEVIYNLCDLWIRVKLLDYVIFCWNSVILTDFLILINISITKVRLIFSLANFRKSCKEWRWHNALSWYEMFWVFWL